MIITPRYGRLGNRLILAANATCHVAKYGGTYLQLGFEEYAQLYPTTAQTGKLLFKSSKPRHWRPRLPFDYLDTSYLTSIPSLIEGYGPYMDMSGKRFRAVEERTHVLFARGWSYRDKMALLEYSDVAKTFFTPVPDVVDTATSLTKRISDNFRRPLVGVHIRQTDYATFRSGEFFFFQDRPIASAWKAPQGFLKKNLCSQSLLTLQLMRKILKGSSGIQDQII